LIAEKTPNELLAHKEFPGDRPSSSLLFLGELDAYKCGQLLALYEHRTSV
jgi:glucose-6-phosphate isomerase